MPNDNGPWHTSDELLFINLIGYPHQGRKDGLKVAETLSILCGYLKGLELRRIWAGMNHAEILAHAEKRIRMLSVLDPKASI